MVLLFFLKPITPSSDRDPGEENDLRITEPSILSASSSATSPTPPSEGRLEIFHGGQWGSVCDDDFDTTDGGVACRQLGFTGVIRIDDPGSAEYDGMCSLVCRPHVTAKNVRNCLKTEKLHQVHQVLKKTFQVPCTQPSTPFNYIERFTTVTHF